MTQKEIEKAIHCMKYIAEIEVCEECPAYKETGEDHCIKESAKIAIQALETVAKIPDVTAELERLYNQASENKKCGLDIGDRSIYRYESGKETAYKKVLRTIKEKLCGGEE